MNDGTPEALAAQTAHLDLLFMQSCLCNESVNIGEWDMIQGREWAPDDEFELSDDHVRSWQRDGWVLLHSLFPAHVVDAVESYVARTGFPQPREFEPPIAKSQFDKMTTFPFGNDEVNQIATSGALASIARRLLECDSVQLYQAQLWLKIAGEASYEQTHHRDYAKNTMLTPRREGDVCDFLSFIVYLTDIHPDSGPTAFASRTLTKDYPLEPARFTRDENPDIYKSEVMACAPRGSAVFYAGDTFHRATELKNGSSRLVLKGAIRRLDAPWVGYVHALRVGFEPDWSRFVTSATSKQLRFLMGDVTDSRIRIAQRQRYLSSD